MLAFLKDVVFEDDGATMVEYGLMLVFIALICLGAVRTLGEALMPIFVDANDALIP